MAMYRIVKISNGFVPQTRRGPMLYGIYLSAAGNLVLVGDLRDQAVDCVVHTEGAARAVIKQAKTSFERAEKFSEDAITLGKMSIHGWE